MSLPDGGLGLHPGGLLDGCLGDLHDLGDKGHTRKCILDVVSLRQRRLSEQQINALGEIVAINARVFLEGLEVFGEPDRAFEALLEDLEIDP